MNIIANTTLLSNFASVDRLDVLHDLLGRVYISVDVYAEIQDGIAEGYNFYSGIDVHIYPLSPEGWLHLASPSGDDELRLFSQLLGPLHRGEASCLAIAAQRGWAFLTDDARARKAARELNVNVSGTLGVLTQAVKADLLPLDDANRLLAQMIQLGYYSPYSSLIL